MPDKTGTLTEGRPTLQAVLVASHVAELELLGLAGSLEKGSEHPMASAIVEGAAGRGARFEAVSDFRAETGKGIAGKVGEREVLVGTEQHRDVDRRQPGYRFGRRAQARYRRSTRWRLAGSKHAVVSDLKRSGRKVAMAGDGTNDAPALAAADVGIAMGSGTDIAMQSAGITLVKGDLRGVLKARKLSTSVMRNVRQNLAFAFFYNTLGIPLAAGVLYPAFGILLSPMLASAAMAFSSVSVIANALRLRHA